MQLNFSPNQIFVQTKEFSFKRDNFSSRENIFAQAIFFLSSIVFNVNVHYKCKMNINLHI